MNFLDDRPRWLERDLLTIGTAIFNIEAAFKLGHRPEKVVLPLSQETLVRIDRDRLAGELEDLLLNVLIEDVQIRFRAAKRPRRKSSYRSVPGACESVCLFSGGVDSYSGILNSALHYPELVGVSVVHGDQAWGSKIIDRVTGYIQRSHPIPIYKLYAPPMMSRGYSQLRGFLYGLFGGIMVSLVKARNLVITEVGPTMYQPRFSPFDSVTMTTHPFVLTKVNRVLDLVLGRHITLVLPYENMTKAEVVAASPLQDGLPLTHSCISLRFGRNDGSCFGCIVRRLGFLVAGVTDVSYTTDPLGRSGPNADNLASLLRFCHDVLFDYQAMPSSSKENIESFQKRDLFRRFALDTFAALYVYRAEKGRLNPDLMPLFSSGVGRLGIPRIEKRIAKVRRSTFLPNFSKTA
jgi:hypothetical protein